MDYLEGQALKLIELLKVKGYDSKEVMHELINNLNDKKSTPVKV